MEEKKVRTIPMPARKAFGEKEKLELNKMLFFYEKKNEDPKYSGLWEKNFAIIFPNTWAVAIQMQ